MSLREFRSKHKQRLSVWAAVAVLVVQPQYLCAADQPVADSSATSHTTKALTVVDVALQTDGLLRGQIVDKQGRPLLKTTIQLTDGRKQWRTQTDSQGRFQLSKLSGATYQVQVGQQVQLLRAWSPGTAPPSASKGLLFVQDSDIVLAQNCASPVCGSPVRAGFGRGKHLLANPFITGGLVAAAIAIPVAIHNSDDDPATP